MRPGHSGLESITAPHPGLSMRFSLKVLPSCLVAISLFGCAEQPQGKIEVKKAAKLPTKPSKNRGLKPGIEAAMKGRLAGSRINRPREQSEHGPAILLPRSG